MLQHQTAGRRAHRMALLGPARLAAILGLVLFAWAGDACAQSGLGMSPIFDYAASGNASAVDYLLKTGTPVDMVNSDDETVLMIAAMNGHLDVLDVAIAARARIDHEDRFGKTALSWAAARGHHTVVERLLKHGADVNHQTREGMTPLMLAVRSDRATVVRLLLRSKADIALQDYTGQTAAGWARSGRDRRIDEMLRHAGAAN
jgi:ankyrin repeat protein